MKVIIRGKGDNEWRHVPDKPYPDETYLQNLIYNSPELIPLGDLGERVSELRVCIKELGLPGSGNTDLVGLDEEGGITIIECKLAGNPEVKRKVLGQVLEYAAHLWRMPYDEFDELIFRKEGQHLLDLMAGVVQKDDWSQENFRDSVSANLSSGNFQLIIVVDSMNEELRRTIQYLNFRENSAPQIYALELRYFPDNQTEVLVPQLYGVTPRTPMTTGRKQWDEEMFFQDAADRNEQSIVEAMRILYDFTKKEGDRTYWGTGAVNGSFTFHLAKGDTWLSLFTVFSHGLIQINFGWLRPRVEEDQLDQLFELLTTIDGFSKLPKDYNKWPMFKIGSVFGSTDSVEKFEDAVRQFKATVI